ncbi:hypothetical protein T492DRAFT_316242 [Pavlovales sp. CCMP2436]|nr:hypothetical protein T492DRAFT_316242 [Pavlovales sp. CCMP2436]
MSSRSQRPSVLAPARRGPVLSGGRGPSPRPRTPPSVSMRPRTPPSVTRQDSEQMEQLREAFATLSDVLVDELDAIRTDAARRWELAEAHLNKHAQSIKSVKAELALLRDEVRTGQQGLGARAGALEVAAEATHAASAQLAQELGAVGSAGELLRLHFEQEREEAGQGGSALEARLGRAIDELGGQLQQQREETDSALSALDRDVTAARELADSIQR